ncbi:MAG: hypothetical protein ACKO9Z_13445 [Planctomycetota bacterium]
MAIRQSLRSALCLSAVLMAQGCVTMPVDKSQAEKPPAEKKPTKHVRKIHKGAKVPCQLVSTWKNEVIHVADPVHGGSATPGLAGRFYLFGEEVDSPIEAEGTLIVDLYDLSKGPSAAQTPLENWQIDPVTLKKLKRKDPVGEGYTLFLPWATYRPDITRIQLKLKYDAGGEFPLYGDTGPISLNTDISFQQSRNMVNPANGIAGQAQGAMGPASNQGQPVQQGIGGPAMPSAIAPMSGPAAAPQALQQLQPVSRVVVPTGPAHSGFGSNQQPGVVPAGGSMATGRSTRLTIEPIDYNPPRQQEGAAARETAIPRPTGLSNQAPEAAAPAPGSPAGLKVWNLR